MTADEKQILERVLAHEDGAFADFLERYRSLIYSVFYGKGFPFPRDYLDDIYQSFVLALAHKDYHRLRSYQGRNNCSLATFLQIVATRFALDELRRWKRHPRGRGFGGSDDEEFAVEVEDPRGLSPLEENLGQEQLDIFHNLLFALEWKRISVVLWVFRAVARETIADVMSTSRANIDALYKRAKDQMTLHFADGSYSRRHREPDPRVLTPDVTALLRELLVVPRERLHEGLLRPGAKQRALLGLVLVNYGEFHCSESEIGRLARGAPVPETCQQVLEELAGRVLP